MGKKGLSVVELIVSFVLCILVFVFIIQVVSSIEELYVNLGIKTELLNKQSLISEEINNKFYQNEILLIKKCGNDCLTFFYRDNTSEQMTIDKSKNTFIFGKNTYSFNGLGFVDSLDITTSGSDNYEILLINLNVKNAIFDNGKYNIKAIYQYDNSKTVYSPNLANKAEIILLGPATSYKFREDLFVEPGWMVYYPDGRITINENDVIPSELTYDADGNGFINYRGASGNDIESKDRFIRNYETAKNHIINLYERAATADLYSYHHLGFGKYVYKGENPRNYIEVGNKLFRILALEIQSQYLLDENGNVVIENGEKVLEDKYLLKVVSEDVIKNEGGQTLMPFGNTSAGNVLYNTSAWMKKTCTNELDLSNCTIHKQYINSVVNDFWLAGLLNTATGNAQIKNGTFNTGMVHHNNAQLRSSIAINENNPYEISFTEMNNYESSEKWHGNCLDDVCEANAAIISLSDALMASADENCLDKVVSIKNATSNYNTFVYCANNNWMWPQKKVVGNEEEADEVYSYRLLTRNNFTNTWILLSDTYLAANNEGENYETKGTLYLDADLYIKGSGTKENPYSLYSMSN